MQKYNTLFRINPKKAEAVIFDIDGTLYSNKMMFLQTPLVYIKSYLWITRYYKMRQKLRYYCEYIIPKIIIDDVVDKQSYNFALFWDKSVEFFAQEVNTNTAQAKILLEKCIYSMWINAVSSVVLRNGMRALLGDLHRKNVPLGILSDFRARDKIKQWNLSPYFSTIVCTEDFATFKPAAEIFKLCCKKMKCDPKKTIYVGNSLKYDGIGSVAAGLIPVLFHRKKKFIESHYGINVVDNVKQLRKFLAEYKLF